MKRTKKSFWNLDIDSSTKKNFLDIDLDSSIKKYFIYEDLDLNIKKNFWNIQLDSSTKSSLCNFELDSNIKKSFLDFELDSSIKKSFLDIDLNSSIKKGLWNVELDSSINRSSLDVDLDSGIKKSFVGIDLDSSIKKGFWNFDFDLNIKKSFVDLDLDLDLDSNEKFNYLAIENGNKFLIEQQYSAENTANKNREDYLNKYILPIFISLLREEDFEFGYITRSEEILRDQFKINALATRNWLNEIFLKYFNDEQILIGVLRIIGRFSEQMIFPQGQTIALASLCHKNDEIKELGIRAFEKWISYDSLNILSKIKTETHWLQEYVDQVILDLNEELCHC